MNVLSRLALLFIGVPLLELFILIQVGQWIGLWPTVGVVVLTGLAGAALARLEGLRTVWRLKTELAKGQLPGQALYDGFAILVGGALLLTPGILTDLVGFSLLLPPTRRLVMGRVRRSLEKRLKAGTLNVTHVSTFSAGPARAWSFRHGEADEGVPQREPHSPTPRPGEIIIEKGERDPD